MTKKLSKLAQLKLDVINYHLHNDESTYRNNIDGTTEQAQVNERFLVGLARDACYTSHNSITFKKKQIADSLAEYDIATENKNIYDQERIGRWISRLTPELDELTVRHDADLEVFAKLTGGEQWQAKAQPTSAKVVDFSNLRKRVA